MNVHFIESYIFLMVLTATSTSFVYGFKENGNCSRAVLDYCSMKLISLGDVDYVSPVNMEQMNKRCKEVKAMEQCIKDYAARCLEGETRNSILVVVYGIAKTNKSYCSSQKRKNAHISFGKCANKNKKSLDKFMNQMIVDYHGVRLYKDPKLRIPLACCNFYKFKDRLVTLLNKDCPNEAVEMERKIDGYTQDGLNLLCGDYTEESDLCSKIINKTPKWTKSVTSKAFVMPMVDIFNSL
ncbi:hypothetical protein BLOT_003342 [Blomia tropicalis]|nr:hypothetical protein BLOT_003342 [Blomia tropicalis]